MDKLFFAIAIILFMSWLIAFGVFIVLVTAIIMFNLPIPWIIWPILGYVVLGGIVGLLFGKGE